MAVPTPPTLVSLTTEALKKSGRGTPNAADLSRAQTEWMEEIKNEILMDGQELKSLYVTSVGVLIKGQSRYANPTDFGSDLSITLMDGSRTGTSQAASAGSLTLASADTSTEVNILGKELLITTGTGKGSLSQITAFNISSKLATVTPNFTTTPLAGDNYMIVDHYYTLEDDYISDFDDEIMQTNMARPNSFYSTGDADNGEFILSNPPNKAYGAKMRYYADLMELDLAGTHMLTLYQKWRTVFIKGLIFKALQSDDDVRQAAAEKEYQRELQKLFFKESFGKKADKFQITL